ncbi:hypothetical protein [uncultured Psychrobacter sp.]|uniref:hypothetical protein n=1 Tax=uncultured Psychrobacter sp. TaxID=259303 RepID=UPI003457F26B
MSHLVNDNENIFITLTPNSKDEFGVMCDLKIETELICFDFKSVSENNRYMSHENINYLSKEVLKLKDLSKYREEDELITSIYPIDMFFTMDVFKANDDLLFIELSIPIGIYSNSTISGYSFGLDFFVNAVSLIQFFESFIISCERDSL